MSTKSVDHSEGVVARAAPEKPTLRRPRRNYARWRALCLSLVYVVFAAHIVHWKLTGQTLAPLELNEVMYTLELGIITAGFLFMGFLVLGSLVFGRFFCSWACHIMVLQDLCAWLLRKLGIRQKPLRSRLLLLVPPLTAAYMFLWPQVLRAWHNRAFPTFHWASDREGWASLVTQNFWRNLPGPVIILLTFLVCGFAIVYLLGSRTFCTYICPYGAIFGLADRFAPGRIRVNDQCQQCGTCTAACTCGVRVHEEVHQHGMIVNPACLKDLDCVGACPQNALHYLFGRPALFRSFRSGGRFGRLPYDFSLLEDLWIGAVFLVVLLSFRSLYSRIPFLLSLGLGGIIGYLAVVVVRLFTRSDVVLATLHLKQVGRLTLPGRAFFVFAVLLVALVGHSGWVRYHEFLGLKQTRVIQARPDAPDADIRAAQAQAHLTTADRWGLIHNPNVERCLLALSARSLNLADVETYARRLLDRFPNEVAIRVQLGQCLLKQDRLSEAEPYLREAVARAGGQSHEAAGVLVEAHQALAGLALQRGDFAAAAEELRAVLTLDSKHAAAYAQLGGALAELGRLDEAVASLSQAVRIDPDLAGAQYNLGAIFGHLGRFAEAIPCYERALTLTPDDADLHNNLGFALLQTGELELAQKHLERAVTLKPGSADAHFNLGNLFTARWQTDRATQHYHIAAALDPRYARLLGNVSNEPPTSGP
jgi:tetratricopeptide (TPR) repeat protein/polyferredoxin